MNIPENKNKVPDLLDEARWELEFELKMQVPAGEKLAGMAHHKIHDAKWTALSLGPHEDPMPRFLHPASTAATLNLAANAAQAARIWRAIDKAFADKCLKAAERAWEAAQGEPGDLRAERAGDGGGPYDDDKRGRRLLLGGGGALHHDQEGRVQGLRRQVGALQERRRRLERQRRHVHVDDLGRHAGARVDLAGDRPQRPRQGGRSTRSGRTSSWSRTST